jgi:hypothetical protein
VGLTDAYAKAWGTQWRTFLARERMAVVPDDLSVVVDAVQKFLTPVALKASAD